MLLFLFLFIFISHLALVESQGLPKMEVNVKVAQDWRRMDQYKHLEEQGPHRFRVKLAKFKSNESKKKHRVLSLWTQAYDVATFKLPREWVLELLEDEAGLERYLNWKLQGFTMEHKNNLFELTVAVKDAYGNDELYQTEFQLTLVENMVLFSLRTLKAKVLPFNTERFLRPERNLVFQVDKSVPQRINLFEIECFPHFINGWHREFPAWKSGKVVSLRERVCPFDKYSLYHDKEDVVHCDEAVYELPGVNVYRIRWNGRKQTFSCRLDKQASHRGMRRRKVPEDASSSNSPVEMRSNVGMLKPKTKSTAGTSGNGAS